MFADCSVRKNGREAAYTQVARRLRSNLQDGSLLTESGRLPSYRELAARFDVSICVIQQAMRMLRAESLVQTSHGKSSQALPGGSIPVEMMKFALIHPYRTEAAFGRSMPYFMMTALERNSCRAMLHVRSSEATAELEREIAENLVYNSIDGIILSPQNSFENVAYFEKLSESVPVMLIDQPFPESDLPATIIDFADGGRQIGKQLRQHGCKRALLLLNNKNNQSITDLVDAMQSEIETVPQYLKIFDAEHSMEQGDFVQFDAVVEELRKAIAQNRCDCIFSPFKHHLDLFYMNGVPREEHVGLAGVLSNCSWESCSRNFFAAPMLEWEYSNIGVMQTALERLLKWCDTRRRPRGVKKLKIAFAGRRNID